MALRELLAMFDIRVQGENQLKALDTTITGVASKLETAAKVFAGGLIATAVKEFVGGQIELGSQINDTADRLGVGTDELQSFQFAAKLSGVEAEGAATALGFLNKNIGGALDGNKELAKTFSELDISLKDAGGNVRELGDVIPEIADSFVKMGSDQERTAKAMAIFGRSGASLLPLLKGGSKGLKELDVDFKRLGGGLTKEFIEAADKAGDEIDKMKFALTGLKSRVVGEVLPGLTNFVMKLQHVISYLIRLAEHTNIVKVAMGGLAGFGIAKVLKSLVALGPEALIIVAAIAALVLIVEDLYTLFTGGDSIIGDFIDALWGAGASAEAVAYVKNEVERLLDATAQLGPLFTIAGNVIGKIFSVLLPLMAGFWKNQLDGSVIFIETFIKGLNMAFKLLGKLVSFGGLSLKQIGGATGVDELKGYGEELEKIGKSVQDVIATNPQAAGDFRPERAYGANASVFVPGAAPPANVTQSNQVEINVHGAGDPAATGRETAGALGGALNGTALRQAAGALIFTGGDE
jgi:hypothetical protein